MKRHIVLICVILDVLAVGIIALNLFVVNFPEWVTVILAAVILGVSTLLWTWRRGRAVSNVLLSLLNLAAAVLVLFGAYCNPYWNSTIMQTMVLGKDGPEYYTRDFDEELSLEEAKRDLDFAVKYLQKCHPALIDGLRPEMEAQYGEAVRALENSGEITVNLLARETERIFSLLGDAHTYACGSFWNWHYFKDLPGYMRDGYSLEAVNGVGLEELFNENRDLYSFEAESWGFQRMCGSMDSMETLDYLGIPIEEGVTFTLENGEGDRKDVTAMPGDFLLYEDYKVYNGLDTEDSGEPEPFVRFDILPERDLAVLTLTECNYNSEYKSCVKEMFTQVREQGIGNVCVDLRDNGGGNSLVANEFIRYLDTESYRDSSCTQRLGPFAFDWGGEIENERYEELLFHGDVYVLTSGSSFSSAMLFAEFICDNGLGTLIGEPPGNDPNGYGDVSLFRMPNSGVLMQVSTKKWNRADRTKTEPLIQPDVSCEAEAAMDTLFALLEG